MSGSTAQRTPLRRVSQGSLRALSRSGSFPDAPHGLGFLEPAMAELADEAEALQANVEGLHTLSRSLETFNESFASYLYVMEMNALTTDWPQAPTDASFELARRRAEEDARVAAAALRAATTAAAEPSPGPDKSSMSAADTTVAATTQSSAGKLVGILKTGGLAPQTKKKAKPKMSAKEKRERSLAIEKTVSCLPLEFRGQDPNLRRNIDAVIEALMDSGKDGVTLQGIVRPPDLNQAKVNKCLIALVNRKIVQRDNSSGSVLYYWGGVPT